MGGRTSRRSDAQVREGNWGPSSVLDSDPERERSAAATDISVIVPAYNEAGRLPVTIDAILALATATTEVILVDDGSTDGTGRMLDAAARNNPHVRVVASSTNRGKGAAVRLGMARARGRALVFMDADLATDLSALQPLVDALDDHHVAMGSRSIAGTVVEGASAKRRCMGLSFNRLARAATGVPYADTQCGFKAFRAPIGKLLFALSRVDGFAFDVEILSLARQLDLRVVEIPIHWRQVEGSHIRLVSDSLRMARDVMRSRRLGLDVPARVYGAQFPCAVGDEVVLRRKILAQVRHFDLAVPLHGSVLVLAPFVPPGHMGELVRRVATATDTDTSSVDVTGRDTGSLLRLIAESRRGRLAEAVNRRSVADRLDPADSAVPVLEPLI